MCSSVHLCGSKNNYNVLLRKREYEIKFHTPVYFYVIAYAESYAYNNLGYFI